LNGTKNLFSLEDDADERQHEHVKPKGPFPWQPRHELGRRKSTTYIIWKHDSSRPDYRRLELGAIGRHD